jgi:hypothetical protein
MIYALKSGKWASPNRPLAQMFPNIILRKYQIMYPEKLGERPLKWGAIFGVKYRIFRDLSYL